MEDANLKEANLGWCNLSETDFTGCDISKANVAWSLTIKTKFSDEQFFAFSPDVMATLKLASPVIGGAGKTASKTHSFEPYSAKKETGEYINAGGNALFYGERGFEVASIYSPKGKKDTGGYRT